MHACLHADLEDQAYLLDAQDALVDVHLVAGSHLCSNASRSKTSAKAVKQNDSKTNQYVINTEINIYINIEINTKILIESIFASIPIPILEDCSGSILDAQGST